LLNHSLFIHSHWNNGVLIAIHAHPYQIDFSEGNQKDDSDHSEQEYFFLEQIFETPYFNFKFFDVQIISPCIVYTSYTSCYVNLYNDFLTGFYKGRAPPGNYQSSLFV
jgi:hypothetical protein